MAGASVHVVLDVSRLLLSVRRPIPSGIDRVEMAYAQRFLEAPAAGSTFVVQSPWGWFGAVPRHRIATFIEALTLCWRSGPTVAHEAIARAFRLAARMQAGLALGMGRGALDRVLERERRCAFLLVSHRALDRDRPIARLRAAGAAFVPLLHDLIPLSHPEYARPAQVGRHARRLATTAALADGIVVNSAATAGVLATYLPPGGPEIAVAPLGIGNGSAGIGTASAGARAAPDPARGDPYFVCLGTIEPRKNHLLLLHLWRDLAEAGGRPPRLLLVGRRGWENENVLDLLDRCPALHGLVEEHGPLPDAAVAPLLAGARALLFPSFAEGYGLPLAEALAAGVPAVCSNLPALREIGGEVPEYLDPLDGRAWRAAVLDYAAPDSPRRAAQLQRMDAWRAPDWTGHFAQVDALLERAVAARSAIRPGLRGAASGAGPAARPALAAGALPSRAAASVLAAAGPTSA